VRHEKIGFSETMKVKTSKNYKNNILGNSAANSPYDLNPVPPTKAFNFKNLTKEINIPSVKRIENNKKQYSNLNRSMEMAIVPETTKNSNFNTQKVSSFQSQKVVVANGHNGHYTKKILVNSNKKMNNV